MSAIENELLDPHTATELHVAAAAHAEGIDIEIGHRRVLERSCSPPPSSLCGVEPTGVGRTMCEYRQEVDDSFSLQERDDHLSESDSTVQDHSHSLSGHFPPRSPSQAAALAGTGAEEAAIVALGTSGVVAQIKALLEAHRLSREQFVSIYDEYVSEREQQQVQLSISVAQAQAAAMLNSSSMVAAATARAASANSSAAININHSNSIGVTERGEVADSDATYDENISSPLLDEHARDEDSALTTHSTSHVEMVNVADRRVSVGTSIETGDISCTESSAETPGRGEEENVPLGGTSSLSLDEDDEAGENSKADVGVGVGANGSHVGKMQSLVRSALESYETASPVMSEIGQKRKHFTLEEELRLQPSPFAQQLLERDQTLVAQAIKRYMNQYSIPQREVVEKTGLNQSHLSQHFLHGVTMKRAKRIKLYHWFEEDQKARTGKLQSADGSLNAVLESPKVEGSRRRPRWKWSPISTQILTEAFKKNQFPTREQRLELSRVCNNAELAMNNGAMIRGPEGDTEGITEQRINTWFTNRRKGLTTPVTPSPTKALTPGGTNLTFAPTFHPLLRAGPATTPVLTPGVSIGAVRASTTLPSNGTPKFGSLTTTPLSLCSSSSGGEERKPSTPVALIPNTVQTLVSQIQQAQVHHHHHHGGSGPVGGVTVATPLSQAAAAQVISTSPSSHLQSSPHLALPLAIALPGGGSASVLSSSSPHTLATTPTPMQTVTVSPNVNPNAIHALLSQLHATSAITAPLQLSAAAAAVSSNNNSSSSLVQPTSIITLPGPAPVSLHNPPPPLTSSARTSSSTTSSPFQAIKVDTGVMCSGSTSKGLDCNTSIGNGSRVKEHRHTSPTSVTALSQAQLQALMSQVHGAKVIADGTSPLAQFQLLTLPAGISLATPTAGGPAAGVSVNSEPPVLWASPTPQGVPQTS